MRRLLSVLVATAAIAAADNPNTNIPNVDLPGGYFIEALTRGLDFPTAIAFSSDRIWVSEAGFLPGTFPKIKEISASGTVRTILSGEQIPAMQFLGPLTDVTYHGGFLWITHRQLGVNGWMTGAISRFDPNNPVSTFVTIIRNLPSSGDHYAEEIVFDGSGRLYFSQGSATNTSVVGADNELLFMWLHMFPTFHDFPAKNIVLSGVSYATPIPFSVPGVVGTLTSPFRPFGTTAPAGTMIPAATPNSPQEGIIAGNGTVYSFDPAKPVATWRLEGWGFRNPYGIGLDPFHPGTLFVSNNGADTRSAMVGGQLKGVESRPVENDWDDMFALQVGGAEEFFGWPDYFHDPRTGQPLPISDPRFCVPGFPCPIQFAFASSFRSTLTVQPAFAEFTEHSSANKFDFAVDKNFKNVGDLFVAETGSFVPISGAEQFVGYRVVRVDRQSGQVSDFVVNTGRTAEQIFNPAGFNKPMDVKFLGELMFIVDFGVYEPGLHLMQPGTGKVWIVSHGKSGLIHFGQ